MEPKDIKGNSVTKTTGSAPVANNIAANVNAASVNKAPTNNDTAEMLTGPGNVNETETQEKQPAQPKQPEQPATMQVEKGGAESEAAANTDGAAISEEPKEGTGINMSVGQIRVGAHVNPGKDPALDKLKELGAGVIDFLQDQMPNRRATSSVEHEKFVEKARQLDLAMADVENAVMRFEKTIF